jgi:electron transfer flavoprotein beta subunit
VSIGPQPALETLRTALAMGADRGVHVVTDARTDQGFSPLAVSKILAHFAKKESANLVIVGKQAIDGDNAQTAPMVAGLLGWSQGTFACGVEVSGEVFFLLLSDCPLFYFFLQNLVVDRETDSGTQKISIKLPAVISADLRLNDPRYATLPNIMKAKKKPVETVQAASLGIDLNLKNKVVSVEDPPSRKAGIVVETVDDLVNKLKTVGAI